MVPGDTRDCHLGLPHSLIARAIIAQRLAPVNQSVVPPTPIA